MSWCGCPVFQSLRRNARKSGNVFYDIWKFCKSSQNLVGMAHRNNKSYLFFAKWSLPKKILHLRDPCVFLQKWKYHAFVLQKVSKNWDLVRKKSVKNRLIDIFHRFIYVLSPNRLRNFTEYIRDISNWDFWWSEKNYFELELLYFT